MVELTQRERGYLSSAYAASSHATLPFNWWMIGEWLGLDKTEIREVVTSLEANGLLRRLAGDQALLTEPGLALAASFNKPPEATGTK